MECKLGSGVAYMGSEEDGNKRMRRAVVVRKNGEFEVVCE